MPRYFLHRRTGSAYFEDAEGDELPDLPAAQQEAFEVAREIMSEDVLMGFEPDGSQIEIADETGNVLAVVTFKSALRLR